MAGDRRGEYREVPWVRQERLRRTLIAHYANEPKYKKEIDRLRGIWTSFGEDSSELTDREFRAAFKQRHSAFRPTITRSVEEKFRLVDRRTKMPLEWAVQWVDCDVRRLASDRGIGGIKTLRNDAGEVVSVLIDPLWQLAPGPMPGFTLSVDLGTIEFTAPGFDPDERWGENFLEHGIFEGAITSEAWDTLETRAHALVAEGIWRMRAQFKAQLPKGYTTRPGGRDSTDESLKTLCRYLLTDTPPIYNETGPNGFRSVNELCNEMGIRWPRRPPKTRK
jgi:hypothetical protein